MSIINDTMADLRLPEKTSGIALLREAIGIAAERPTTATDERFEAEIPGRMLPPASRPSPSTTPAACAYEC